MVALLRFIARLIGSEIMFADDLKAQLANLEAEIAKVPDRVAAKIAAAQANNVSAADQQAITDAVNQATVAVQGIAQ